MYIRKNGIKRLYRMGIHKAVWKIGNVMIIKVLKACNGDCLHIIFIGESGKKHNIIIDSGPSSFGPDFEKYLDSIRYKGETIDFICLTHQDDDHICGMLYYLKHGKNFSHINEIWMNHKGRYSSTVDIQLSTAHRNELYLAAVSAGICIKNKILKDDVIKLDGMKILVLAPVCVYEEGKEFEKKADVQLSKSTSDFSKSLDELANKKLPTVDASKTNQSSIVLLMEFAGKSILLCGDSPANIFLPSVPQPWPKKIDVVKLPHHGSARNLREGWDRVVNCQKYIISADGGKHPDKQTIAKLRKWYGSISVYSHTDWWNSNFWQPVDIQYKEKIRFSNESIIL